MRQATELWREPWWFPPPPAADAYNFDTGIVRQLPPVDLCRDTACSICRSRTTLKVVRAGDPEYVVARRRQLDTYARALSLAERLWADTADEATSRAWTRGRELFLGLLRPVQHEMFLARGQVLEGNWRLRVGDDYLSSVLTAANPDDRARYFYGYPMVASFAYGEWTSRCVYLHGWPTRGYVLWDHVAAILLMARTEPWRLDRLAPKIGPAYD